MRKTLSAKQQQDWERLVRFIQTHTPETVESREEREARLLRCKTDYNFYCRYYFPHYAEVDCAEYHLEIAHNILENPKITQFNIIYRGGAKSVHANLMIPLWLLFFYDQLHFMVLVGENDDKAKILLRDIQAELQFNQRIAADFGKQHNHGDWSNGEFSIRSGTFFKSIGINMSARGLRNYQYRPDYISIDDIEDRKKANNQQIVAERVDKVIGDIAGSFGKDYERLVISNNLIHKKGVIATLLNELSNKPTTKITRRDAIDKNGNPTWKERYSVAYWIDKIKNTRKAQWEREYKNNPVEEGLIFKDSWMRFKTMSYANYKSLILYGDLSYKTKGDYKALVLLGKPILPEEKGEIHLLTCFIRKTSLQTIINYCYDLRERIPEDIHIDFYIEANFIQDMFVDAFYEEGKKRGAYLNVRGDKRNKPDKYDRIESLSPIFERPIFFFNKAEENSEDTQELISQFLLFEKGSNAPDDGPDAVEGGNYLLNHKAKTNVKPTLIQRIRKNFY